ncbi:MAG: alpha/beta hydrolase-fold protein [Bacteroidota bacterium]
MQSSQVPAIHIDTVFISSGFLQRKVEVDIYLPHHISDPLRMNLLLINDGQDMKVAGLQKILKELNAENALKPLMCIGIHAGAERRMEYGVASQADYSGRGAKAGLYSSFVLEELMPYLKKVYSFLNFIEISIAGFSLGGLTAIDLAWNHPGVFKKAGIFSGSFWWRSVDQTDERYDDDKHRIMQQQIRNGSYKPGLKFFFQCGNMDETMDRNQNGLIDSIDDTLDVIKELEIKGYKNGEDIYYMEMNDGRHDVETWGRALPVFLKWGWGRSDKL